eukprot:c20174_g1_i4 orf=161-544(-)
MAMGATDTGDMGTEAMDMEAMAMEVTDTGDMGMEAMDMEEAMGTEGGEAIRKFGTEQDGTGLCLGVISAAPSSSLSHLQHGINCKNRICLMVLAVNNVVVVHFEGSNCSQVPVCHILLSIKIVTKQV